MAGVLTLPTLSGNWPASASGQLRSCFFTSHFRILGINAILDALRHSVVAVRGAELMASESTLSEAAVREEIIAPILKELGYRSNSVNDIRYELNLRYPRDFLGHKKPTTDHPFEAKQTTSATPAGAWLGPLRRNRLDPTSPLTMLSRHSLMLDIRKYAPPTFASAMVVSGASTLPMDLQKRLPSERSILEIRR
jgi:hypothetical protein